MENKMKLMMGDVHPDKKQENGDTPLKKELVEEDTPPTTPEEGKLLMKIARKKYEEGDTGKMEALRDIQSVFDELHQEKVLERVNVFATPDQDSGPKQSRKRLNVTALTPLIPMNLDKFKVKNKEFSSEQNLLGRGQKNRLQTPSLPLIPNQGGRNDSDAYHSGMLVVAEDSDSEVEAEAFRRVKGDLEMVTPVVDQGGDSVDSEAEEGEDSQTKATDSEDALWKQDLARVAKIRSTSKINMSSLIHDRETFQLKYKPPIWPHQLGLWQILADLPAITCLILDGSELECLRDLGSSLPSLVTLSVARCGLTSLDGTGALPYLRTLIASNNQLQYVIQVSYLTELCHLDVSSNPIRSLDTFAHLKACPKLTSLKMYATPASRSRDFNVKMKAYLPSLKELYPTSGGSDWTWSKSRSSSSHGRKKEDSRVKSIMAHEFEVIYQNNFQKKRPLPQKDLNAPDGDIFEEAGNQSVLSDGGFGTPSEMEEDNFDELLVQSIRKLGNVSKDSYITEIDGNEAQTGAGEGDSDWFYSAENSETEAFEDASAI